MRCLYCAKQLALLRRLTGGGEFCSDAHKQSYHEEYNRLALSRLLQAQSKPEDFDSPTPAPQGSAGTAGFPEQPREDTSRDPAQGWTTVNRTSQKRLRAPAPPSVLEASVPETDPAPGAANFLVDKPLAKVPDPPETSPTTPTPLLAAPAPVHPQLACKLAEYDTFAPPPGAGLMKLPQITAPPLLSSPHPAESQLVQTYSQTPIEIDLRLGAGATSGFEQTDLLPMEIQSEEPVRPEPELQPAIDFLFPCVFEERANLGSLAGGPEFPEDGELQLPWARSEEVESVQVLDDTVTVPAQIHQPERLVLGLLPLNIRPIPPGQSRTAIRFEQLPMRTFEPELPASSPLPLRPSVAASDPIRVSSRTRQATVKMKLAWGDVPVQGPAREVEPSVTPQEASARSSALEGDSEADLPSFLKEHQDPSGATSMWGNVHKYLKNIVNCLLLASLGGGVYWHFRTNPILEDQSSIARVADVSSADSQPVWENDRVGEADRARPERQIFMYPPSMLLSDYRVEFDVPLTSESIDWVFRVMDPRNYCGMRLDSGRDRTGGSLRVQKYVEVEGEHVPRGAFTIELPADAAYCRIRLEVEGTQFLTYAQGRLVDRWNDQRFIRGGFGYYGGGRDASPLKSAPIKAVRISALDGTRPRVESHE